MINSDFIKFNQDELERQPNGYLSLLATITRTGVFTYEYMNELGESIVLRQLRHPEDVFNEETMASLIGLPVTNEHPSNFVEPDNSAKVVVGMASDKPKELVIEDDSEKYVQQLVTLFDPDTIEDVVNGDKRELSLGYTLDHDETPGVWNGQEYDVRQKNIKYNHLSVVKKARGGSNLKFNLDSEAVNVDGISYDKVLNFNTLKGEDSMIFNRDGKEYDVKDDVHALLTTLEAERKKATDDLESKVAKLDAMQEKVSALSVAKETDAADAKFKEAVATRVKLEKEASKVLGEAVSLDGLTDREIMVKVVSTTSKVNLDGKSDAYVAARYDFALETEDTTDLGKKFIEGGKTAADSDDIVEVARKKAWDIALNQWKGAK